MERIEINRDKTSDKPMKRRGVSIVDKNGKPVKCNCGRELVTN